jgi:hypothetical protein
MERARSLRTRYGLSEADFARLLEKQQHMCAICHSELKDPQVDHSHTTGEIRGLLCRVCNLGLGHFEKFRESAEKYLDNPPASRVH